MHIIDMPRDPWSQLVRNEPSIRVQLCRIDDGWTLVALPGTGSAIRLARKIGGPRLFRSLDTAWNYLRSLGHLQPLETRVVDQGRLYD